MYGCLNKLDFYHHGNYFHHINRSKDIIMDLLEKRQV